MDENQITKYIKCSKYSLQNINLHWFQNLNVVELSMSDDWHIIIIEY